MTAQPNVPLSPPEEERPDAWADILRNTAAFWAANTPTAVRLTRLAYLLEHITPEVVDRLERDIAQLEREWGGISELRPLADVLAFLAASPDAEFTEELP